MASATERPMARPNSIHAQPGYSSDADPLRLLLLMLLLHRVGGGDAEDLEAAGDDRARRSDQGEACVAQAGIFDDEGVRVVISVKVVCQVAQVMHEELWRPVACGELYGLGIPADRPHERHFEGFGQAPEILHAVLLVVRQAALTELPEHALNAGMRILYVVNGIVIRAALG